MHELTQAVPDADVLPALEPEELGAKLLFLLRKRSFQRNMFLPANLIAELWPSVYRSRRRYQWQKWLAHFKSLRTALRERG